MIPGEMFIKSGTIELNAMRRIVTLTVANTGDRPIQVGSHYHFYETNPALRFDRMFLHARELRFTHPASGETITLAAPLPPECETLLAALRRAAP